MWDQNVEQNIRYLESKTKQFSALYNQQLSDDNTRVFDLLLLSYFIKKRECVESWLRFLHQIKYKNYDISCLGPFG